MPRRVVPTYRLHRPSGRAVVTLGDRTIYLGKYDSPESHREYNRVIAEWLANGRTARPQPAADLTVSEVMLPYLRHARAYYVKDGRPTGQVWLVERSIERLTELYGDTPARAFGPLRLKAIQQQMITAGLARGYINQTAGCIKLAFRWCVSEELVPAAVAEALAAVPNLHKGRSGAAEPARVTPVDPWAVDATLPHCHPTLAAMIQVHRYSGMRPGEVCAMRRGELSLSPFERLTLADGRTLAAIPVGDVTVGLYAPRTHKTAHHDKPRVIMLGPRAIEALAPFRDRPADAYLFSPREATVNLLEDAGRKVKFGRERVPGACYSAQSYGHAVTKAIHRANRARWLEEPLGPPELFVPHWHPNKLRHAVATLVHEQWDIHTAAAVLGHAKPDVTTVYVEQALQKAAAAMAKVG